MRHKQFVLNNLEAQINLLENLKKSLESGTVNRTDAFAMMERIKSNLQLLVDRVELEHEQ